MNLPELDLSNSPVISYLMNSVKIAEVTESTDFTKVVLSVESLIVKEMTERHLISQIQDKYAKLYNKPALIEFIVESRQQSLLDYSADVESTPSEQEKSYSLPIAAPCFQFKNKYELSRQYSFDNLIPTLENSFSIESLQTIVTDKSITMPFALIKGPSGAGKSHMLHAVGWLALSQYPNLRVKVISGDEFINDFQTALFTKTTGAFRDKYRLKTDFLLIDDIQAIARAKATQLELFNLMNDYSLVGKKIFFTADSDLMAIDTIEDRLKSRFLSGLQLQIESPCYDSKMKYFRAQLEDNQLSLNGDLILNISQHFGSCYRSVEGIINRLIMLKKISGYLDIQAIEKMFPQQSKEKIKSLSVDSIIEDTALKHKLRVSDLKSKCRTKIVFAARKESMLRLRSELNLTVNEIARIFQRDHTSILNALKN
ncbi:MAG: DnaA/Hda family protein [Bdellovibrionota bacterium]